LVAPRYGARFSPAVPRTPPNPWSAQMKPLSDVKIARVGRFSPKAPSVVTIRATMSSTDMSVRNWLSRTNALRQSRSFFRARSGACPSDRLPGPPGSRATQGPARPRPSAPESTGCAAPPARRRETTEPRRPARTSGESGRLDRRSGRSSSRLGVGSLRRGLNVGRRYVSLSRRIVAQRSKYGALSVDPTYSGTSPRARSCSPPHEGAVEERRSVGGDELLARTPVLWAYRPVRIVALEGQQSGVVATALLNRVHRPGRSGGSLA
jgi:hypothetical protein